MGSAVVKNQLRQKSWAAGERREGEICNSEDAERATYSPNNSGTEQLQLRQ